MKYYKLTDTENQTFFCTQWGENVTNKATGSGKILCSSDVIHVYDHPLKAVLFNPIHANFSSYNLWECRVRQVVANDKLKVGVKICTTIRQIEAPIITTNQRVRAAIYFALTVYEDIKFKRWAYEWLSGRDRSPESAAVAGGLALGAAESARAAVWAARSAESAGAAVWAARSAESVALATAAASWLVSRTVASIDCVAIIKRAIKEEK